MTPERDPRVDPKRGDRLHDIRETRDFTRKVERVTPTTVSPRASVRRVVYYHQYYNWVASCSLASWRKWAKSAEVIHRAD